MDSDFRVRRVGPKSPQAQSDAQVETNTPPKTVFRTPEEAAAIDDVSQPVSLVKDTAAVESGPAGQPEKPGWRDRLHLQWPPDRREWLAIGIIVILLAGGITYMLTHTGRPTASAAPKHMAVKITPQPTTVPSTLSGLPVAPSVNQRPVTGVMIENSPDARPQAGLSQAGVVFEAVAEGGVTRFLALYQDTQPSNLGPVRSARPYYVSWALGFDAGYAHVGGSADALADIKAWGVRDLDQFYNAGAYHRISSRAAPHNVYTSIAALNQLETSKGYTSSTFTGFPRKKEAPSKQPTATSIKLTLSGSVYNVQYTYTAVTNSYARSEGGAAQIDANTNTQLSPKVVIAMVIPETQGALDSSGAYYSDYNVIGSGTAYIFQDGTVTIGQWTKSSNTSQIGFTTSSGQVIPLNPGQTWLTAITSTKSVTYSP